MFFDALVLVVVVLAAGFGAWRGFAKQVAGLIAPAVGIGAGWPLSVLLPQLNRWLAFGLIYLLITLIVFGIAALVRKKIEKAGLEGWDNHLGFLLGAAKGCVLVITLTILSLALSRDLRGRVTLTRTGGLMAQVVREVRPLLSPRALGVLGPWFDLLEPPQRRNA
jgi:membrane protein required for colicin V production